AGRSAHAARRPRTRAQPPAPGPDRGADRAAGDGPRGPARHAHGTAFGRAAPGAEAPDGDDGVAAAPAAGRAHRGTRSEGRGTGAPHDAGDREPPAPDDTDGDPLALPSGAAGRPGAHDAPRP